LIGKVAEGLIIVVAVILVARVVSATLGPLVPVLISALLLGWLLLTVIRRH